MEDREFFDLLYAQFAKTTGAEKRFWMPEECPDFHVSHFFPDPEDPLKMWAVYAVEVDEEGNQDKAMVGVFRSEEDADFITAVHGCLPDLIRSLHTAHDEADRLDERADDREREMADLALENLGLREEIVRLERLLDAGGPPVEDWHGKATGQ